MTLRSAIETGDLTRLPSRRDEDWRWTDLRGLIREMPDRSPEGSFDADRSIAFDGPFGSAGPGSNVEFVNGYCRGPAPIGAASGETQTYLLRFVSDQSAGAHTASLSIVANPNSRIILLESYEGLGSDYVSNTELDIVLSEGAEVVRVVIADDSADAVSVCTAKVAADKGARYAQTILTTGAKRQRFETHVAHPGAGAHVRLDSAYLVGGKRHADLTTVVTHAGEDGATDQLTKGAVSGQGRGVFQGRIVVEKGADQTDARMGHHALILDDRAEVDAKPELLIFADDVQCAHGNTVGQLDEQAIFYARQRGIPQAQARAMLTEAFVGEVIDRIDHEAARDIARAWAEKQLREMVS